SVSVVGSPETVHRGLTQIVARYRPDELMVTGMIHDHAARVKSFDIAAQALAQIQITTQAA
ncbi:MAG TPA: alkane 1-monooxygenase, partial [Paracoccaceae bacterium]|nr:alkane 1-monooxygenase [Paracoccaceae bacterium]